MDAKLPKLDYAPPPARSPRRSLWALASICCPIAGLPLCIIMTQMLYRTYRPQIADRIGMLVWAAASAIGLLAAVIGLARIRRSAGTLRGRPIAIVGMAFSIVFLVWAIVITGIIGAF
jgi:hypothetical protein